VTDQETQLAVAKKGVAARARIWQGDNAEEEVSTNHRPLTWESYTKSQQNELTNSHKGDVSACAYCGSRFLGSYLSSSDNTLAGG